MHSDKKTQQGEAKTPYVQQIHIKQGTRLALENILGSPKIVAVEEQEAGACAPPEHKGVRPALPPKPKRLLQSPRHSTQNNPNKRAFETSSDGSTVQPLKRQVPNTQS